MLASALDKVVTLAGEVLFEMKPLTSIKLEATPGDRIDLRISGQLCLRRKSGNTFLTSRLTRQLLNSPNTSMLIADVTKNCAQKKAEHVEYYPVTYNDSENHAEEKCNLERHAVSLIEDRVQCPKCLRYWRPGETFCGCGLLLQGITDELKKQAEQRINSRYIMYVPDIHDRSKGADAMENLMSHKLKRAKDYLDSSHKHNCGMVGERYLNDEQYQKRKHEQGYAQTEMKDFDRTVLGKKNHKATLEERYDHRDGRATQSRRRHTVKTREHPENKLLVLWNRENLTSHFSKSRCRTVVVVVIMDTVLGGTILHHRTHGDSHPNLLHLTSQDTS